MGLLVLLISSPWMSLFNNYYGNIVYRNLGGRVSELIKHLTSVYSRVNIQNSASYAYYDTKEILAYHTHYGK